MRNIDVMPVGSLATLLAQSPAEGCAAVLCSSYPINEALFAGIEHISVNFDDVEDDRESAFKAETAERIASFVLGLPEQTDLIFCCDGGVSRSAALAAAFTRYFGGDEMKIWLDPAYRPNTKVYALTLRALGVAVTDGETAGLRKLGDEAFRKSSKF